MTVLPARIEALCQATIWKFLEGVDILKRTIYDSLILKKACIFARMLILYPLIGAAVGLIVYLLARKMPKLRKGLVILASGIGLILLCSVMVTLTAGKMPLFMLAEPVILLLTVIAFIICALKSRKTRR
jgi:hypothetical protein